MKLAVIGGGSTYTPELMSGLIKNADTLNLKEVFFQDIDEKRLEIVGGLCQRMLKESERDFFLKLTSDLQETLTGADFVLNQIRVGGQEARRDDTKFCLQHDIIGQETTGPGGFAKALRTIPVVLKLCEKIKKLAPDSWLINFTNPAGIITESVVRHSKVKVIGLCNVPINMKMRAAEILNTEPEDVFLDYVGLNHLSWVRKVYLRGKEVTEKVLPQFNYSPANNPDQKQESRFWEGLNMIANSYLNYFYFQSETLKKLQQNEQVRAEEVMKIEKELLKKYKNKKISSPPQELEERGGAYYSTIAVNLIRDIYTNRGTVRIVNTENQGAIPDLPPDSVVEVPAVIDARGANSLTRKPLEKKIRGLIQQVKCYEELTIAAVIEKDYNKALVALSNNPLVPSVIKAEKLLDYFIERHELELY